MALRYYANAPATTLSSAITAAAVQMTVASVTGLPVQYPYVLIIDRGQATEEVVEVTAAAGTTLTVTRGVDSTTAFAHSINATVEHGISARDIREANDHINDSTGVHGIGGTSSVVGTTDTQTLTGKTISADNNTISGMAASSFALTNASGNLDGAAAQKAIPAGAVVGTTDTQTLTNKNLSSATNTFPADLMPIGVTLPYAGATAPSANWKICDGSAVSRTTYADLFAAIGTAFGAGDGSTTFNLPDLRDRTPVGKSATKGLGSTGGAASVTLTTTELPAHTHSINHDHGSFVTGSTGAHDHLLATRETGPGPQTTRVASAGGTGATSDANTAVVSGGGAHTHPINVPSFTGTSGSAGSGSAFSVQNPYQALNYIIRAL